MQYTWAHPATLRPKGTLDEDVGAVAALNGEETGYVGSRQMPHS